MPASLTDLSRSIRLPILALLLLAAAAWAPGAMAQQPGESLKDCETCPEMVVLPAGNYLMGSPEDERKRNLDEGPRHEVTIARPFAVGRTEVTWREFTAFVQATGFDTEGRCWQLENGQWQLNTERVTAPAAQSRSDDHPVVCVSWGEAQDYVAWLSKETGQSYRLLSEAEWEYAARAGTDGSRFWGEDRSRVCEYANAADQSAGKVYEKWSVADCDDGHVFWAPVGSYAPNQFGLYDMLGNVWEWTADCWHPGYEGAPTDGSAWTEGGDCERRVLRGGAFSDTARALRSADRRHERADLELDLGYGFRVARDLP